MDAEDARKLNVPHIVLASRDEPADVVAEYAKIVPTRKGGDVSTYDTVPHGWMGARCNFEDETHIKEYQRG